MVQKTKRVYGLPGMIADYFRSRPDIDITIGELTREFNVSKDQVHTAMHRLVGIQPTIIRRGQVWKWTPEEQAVNLKLVPETSAGKVTSLPNIQGTPMLFEYVGKTKDQKVIVRDESQTLYRLEEM